MALRLPPQEPDVNSRLKALYIYNFTNMVEWPKEQKTGNFNIGVFGETNLLSELVKYNSKSVGSQPIKVTEYRDMHEIPACHILFVSREKSDKTAELVKKFKAKNTLIITEKEGSLHDGAIINFIIRNNKQSYELSKTNAIKHKLIIGKQLTELAVKVE
jgi:hypothetical protein